MKKYLSIAAAGLLALGCTGGLKTATYTDDQAMPLAEGRTDSLLLSISLEYPVKGADKAVLSNITTNILSTAFDLEEEPGTVEETALRYEENLRDEYFTENEDIPASDGGVLSWEDRINGYFSDRWHPYATYMVEYYNFRGGAHGISTLTPIVFDTRTGDVVAEEDFFAEGYAAPVGVLIQAGLADALDHNEEDLDALFEPDLVGPNGSYEVGKNGVTWYYQPYEIGPYYLGVISVTLPWKDLKPYLR